MSERILKPAEVARRFRVDPKTLARWARDGKIPCIETPGGHRRFRESDVEAMFKWEKEGDAVSVEAQGPDDTGTGQPDRAVGDPPVHPASGAP